MKTLLFTLLLALSVLTASAQAPSQRQEKLSLDKSKELLEVEAACGQCKLGLPGKSCDLAIRVKGKSYFVDGTDIDSHGDAHADDGFCNSVRKAVVQGEIINDRFKATYFKLAPEVANKEKGASLKKN